MLSNQIISRFDRWIELMSALILALATVCTAWYGYQASRWGGEQTTHYFEAVSAGLRGAHLANQGNQVMALHVNPFVEWSAAASQGNQVLADFLYQRFTPELKNALDASLATNPQHNPQAPTAPFAMPQYVLPEYVESDRLAQVADKLFKQASEENEISDRYVLLTVIFASVLFFAGINGKVVLIQPEQARPILANFMGMFWLARGVISLRWGASGERLHWFAVLTGVIGVLAGLAMLTRGYPTNWVSEDILFSLLGLVILLTGILHISGGFRAAEGAYRKWSLTAFFAGSLRGCLRGDVSHRTVWTQYGVLPDSWHLGAVGWIHSDHGCDPIAEGASKGDY